MAKKPLTAAQKRAKAKDEKYRSFSELSGEALWVRMADDEDFQWLVKGAPLSDHFLKSIRLSDSFTERRDYFLASKKGRSSTIIIGEVEFYWTSGMFNVRDTQAQNWIAENPKISDSELIEKFISKEMGVVERTVKSVAAEDRAKTAKILKGGGAIALFIFFIWAVDSCEDSIRNYDDRSQSVKDCMKRTGTDGRLCRGEEDELERRKKAMDEYMRD